MKTILVFLCILDFIEVKQQQEQNKNILIKLVCSKVREGIWQKRKFQNQHLFETILVQHRKKSEDRAACTSQE